VLCSAVQCSAMQCSAVLCCAIKSYAVLCSAMQYTAVQCCPVLCSHVHGLTRCGHEGVAVHVGNMLCGVCVCVCVPVCMPGCVYMRACVRAVCVLSVCVCACDWVRACMCGLLVVGWQRANRPSFGVHAHTHTHAHTRTHTLLHARIQIQRIQHAQRVHTLGLYTFAQSTLPPSNKQDCPTSRARRAPPHHSILVQMLVWLDGAAIL